MACTTTAPPVTATCPARAAVPVGRIRRPIVRALSAALRWLTARPVVLSDPFLEILIVRRDDRLLKDAGLRPEDVMGRWRYFREHELDPMLERRPRW
jgi:hypothetical protein